MSCKQTPKYVQAPFFVLFSLLVSDADTLSCECSTAALTPAATEDSKGCLCATGRSVNQFNKHKSPTLPPMNLTKIHIQKRFGSVIRAVQKDSIAKKNKAAYYNVHFWCVLLICSLWFSFTGSKYNSIVCWVFVQFFCFCLSLLFTPTGTLW